MRIAVFDYGAGNLHSLGRALALGGDEVRLETDALACLADDLVVLPGVGAFAHAAAHLAPARAELRCALRDGFPAIGICLGMQLLFERSDEGAGDGIGLFDGSVTRIRASRVPHIGWNGLAERCDAALQRVPLETAYYANGFACRPAEDSCATAWTTHESDRFPAIVRTARTVGVQFHPEKSSCAGVAFLQALLDEVRS